VETENSTTRKQFTILPDVDADPQHTGIPRHSVQLSSIMTAGQLSNDPLRPHGHAALGEVVAPPHGDELESSGANTAKLRALFLRASFKIDLPDTNYRTAPKSGRRSDRTGQYPPAAFAARRVAATLLLSLRKRADLRKIDVGVEIDLFPAAVRSSRGPRQCAGQRGAPHLPRSLKGEQIATDRSGWHGEGQDGRRWMETASRPPS